MVDLSAAEGKLTLHVRGSDKLRAIVEVADPESAVRLFQDAL